MARIAICNVAIEQGDAVSNDILAMFHLLSALGHRVCLFSHNAPSAETPEPVRPIAEALSFLRRADSVLILHFAIGWDAGLELLRACPGRKVFRYHNITPPEFFEGIHSGYFDLCRAGRKQLAQLSSLGVDLYLPCSQFSRDELVSSGAPPERCRVVPPFHQTEALEDVEADLEQLDRWNDGYVNLLTVGRVAPNKGHAAMIEGLAVYRQLYESRSRLIVVGRLDPKLQLYCDSLLEQARRRGIESALVFIGKVSLAGLKALYLTARLLFVASRHEGFCVPLLEAMRLRVPIVGYGCEGVRETLGEAGVLWDEEDPALLAVSIHRVVRDQMLAHQLTEVAWNRYATKFAPAIVKQRFVESLGGIL